MVDARTWQTVRAGESPDLVLAADFPITGRSESGFPDLAARVDLDCSLWQTVPRPVNPDAPLDVAEYIRPWIEEVRASGREVRAVLGYCAGAVFASALAAEIGTWQATPPRIVVFDPEVVTVPAAHIQFGRVIGNMTSVLTAAETGTLQRVAEELADRPGVGVADFAAGLFRAFRPIGLAAFGRAGMAPEFADELVDLIGSFMSYLSAAARFDPRAVWRRATAISSASAGSGLSSLAPDDGDATGRVAEELSFSVEHHDLLRDDDVARTVTRLLEK